MRISTGIGRSNIGQPVRLDGDLSDVWSDALKKACIMVSIHRYGVGKREPIGFFKDYLAKK